LSTTGNITLRPATPTDRPFLEAVYAESRRLELDAIDWTDLEKIAFCRSQFEAQDSHYREHFPGCEYLVIERSGTPIGRLYKDRRPDEIRVVDITLLEAERGRGIGGRVMQEVLNEAASDGIMVRIHVERSNPARRLYDRLGFLIVEEGEMYDLLSWTNIL
jgi:GNAT superfamily N-acetyltransferase